VSIGSLSIPHPHWRRCDFVRRCLPPLLLGIAELAAAGSAAQPPREWQTVGGDAANTRYSTLTRVNRSNVQALGGAWVRTLESPTRTPALIAGGLLYINDATSLYALDPVSGATVWSFRPQGAAPARGGVAIGGDLLFCGLSDSHIVALERKTGKLVWTGFIGNPATDSASHSRAGFGPGAPQFDLQVGSIANAPVYVDGKVISGLTGGDLGVPGKVVALEAQTGTLAWSFEVVPREAQPGSQTWSQANRSRSGGGAVWTTGAADPALGLVYYGTGNPTPTLGGETRAGDNLYTASVIALDVQTGHLRWHYQLVHHDLWDMDTATPLVLYTTRVNGKLRRGLAAMRTDGYLFLLDRQTGAPLLPIRERPVKQDIRLQTAPTQPFPEGVDRLGPACADQAQSAAGYQMICYFDPVYYDRPNAMSPFITARHAPMSFDPTTGYFYVMGTVGPWWLRRVENPYVVIASRPPGTHEYGIYAAIDSHTGKIVWQRQSAWGLAVGSGALTTAGGLLFHMQGDGNFMASDARNGNVLWQFQTGLTGVSGPAGIAGGVPAATYEANGEQYIVAPLGNGIWAFKLNGRLPPRSPPPPPPHAFGFTGMVESLPAGGEIAVGTLESFAAGAVEESYPDEYGFKPARAALKAGASVKFTNFGVQKHTIVASDNSWTTGEIEPAQSVSIAIERPGNYMFFDEQYPFSKGQLIVR
jgi:alcohol dehydrogenase (cytochrome c)